MPSPNDSLQKTLSFTVKVNSKELDAKYQVLSIQVWHAVNKVARARIKALETRIDALEKEEAR